MNTRTVFVSYQPDDARFADALLAQCRSATGRPGFELEWVNAPEAADALVVLLGCEADSQTRQHVEVAQGNVVALLLPTYHVPPDVPEGQLRATEGGNARHFWPGNVSATLMRAIDGGDARLYAWTDDAETTLTRLHRATLPANTPGARVDPRQSLGQQG